MSEPLPDDIAALRMLRRHRAGTLLATILSEQRAERVRFVTDPDSGRIVLPLSAPLLDADEHALFAPDETDGSLQMLLDLDRSRAAPEALVDRWRIFHGDPPGHVRAPGDLKGEPAKVGWAMFDIESARVQNAVIEGDFLMRPNPLAGIEAAVCKRLNADKALLSRLVAKETGGGIENPVCVGLDPEGLHVRGPVGLARIPFPDICETTAAAQKIVEDMITRAGTPG